MLPLGMSQVAPEPLYSRQLHLPIFPSDATRLGSHCSVMERDEQVWYFLYDMPVFSHAVDDLASFRMYTSSLCDQGHCKLVEVERAFSVSAISVKRALKRFREEGVASFFVKKAPLRKPRVFDEATIEKVQDLLDQGCSPARIEELTGIKADTTRRAILAGRLRREPKKKRMKLIRHRELNGHRARVSAASVTNRLPKSWEWPATTSAGGFL